MNAPGVGFGVATRSPRRTFWWISMRPGLPVNCSDVYHVGWLLIGLYKTDPVGPHPPENHLEDLFRNLDRRVPVPPHCIFNASKMADAVSSEYLYLHLHPQRAVLRTGAAVTTRGAFSLELERALFAALKAATGHR